MNFDGTYPGTNKSETGKLLECQNGDKHMEKAREANRQVSPVTQPTPVRVVVSYPQSEEWDGHTSFFAFTSWSRRKWVLVITITGLIIFSIVTAILILTNKTSSHKSVKEESPTFEIERPDDEALRRYLITQVTKHYQQKRTSSDRETQLAYFTLEQRRLNRSNITAFLNDLDLPTPVALPKDPEMNLDIADFISNHLSKAKTWLSYLISVENKLATYEFQINRKEEFLRLEVVRPPSGFAADNAELIKLREEYAKSPQVAVDNGSVVIDGKVLVFSEVVSILESLTPQSIKKVVLTSSIIYLNYNLTRNIDLIIFSPDWRFIKNINIDLSGAHANDNVQVKDGQSGKPGNNGGFFLGVGNLDEMKIAVVSNGGNGGPGHDGADGRNGTAHLRPQTTMQNPQCILPEGEPNMNPAGESMQLYKVYADEACGEEGAVGGAAGRAGQGGGALLITPNFQSAKWGKDGKKAVDGQNGRNGVTPAGGCYYYAYNLTVRPKRGRWNAITSVRCDISNQPPLKKNISASKFQSKSQTEHSVRNHTEFKFGVDVLTRKARDNLELFRDDKLFPLLEMIEDSPFIVNVSTTLSLIEEYDFLHGKYTQVEIFQSFLKKLGQVLRFSVNQEDQAALKYLQVAVQTKITHLRTTFGEYYIVDIAKYIQLLLHTVERLDVEIFKMPSNGSKSGLEIQQKLAEFRRLFLSTSDAPCEEIRNNDTDARIYCLTSAVRNTLPHFIDIAYNVLAKAAIERSYKDMNKTIQTYVEWKQTYYMGAISQVSLIMNKQLKGDPKAFVNDALLWNRTIAEPIFACAEMMIVPEHCDQHPEAIDKWETFKEMDWEILDAYRAFDKLDPIKSISTTLKIIVSNIRKSRASTSKATAMISDLRSSVDDLLVMMGNCRGFLEENKIRERVAEISQIKIPQDGHLAQTVSKLKNVIVKNLLWYYYQKAYFAYQQWAYPYMDTISKISIDASKEEMIQEIQSIQDSLSTYRSIIQERDTQIKEGEFQLTSSLGPFYTWTNADYRGLIMELLKGHKVQMRASLENNPHIPLKQAVKFRTAEIRLSGPPQSTLMNFAVEMTHSGFSHFLHNGTTYTAVGPQVTLYYSFDANSKGNRPSVVNQVYKKIKNGDIILSPFTNWIVQLQGVNNRALFQDLLKYANVTNVHLVGTGWYTSL